MGDTRTGYDAPAAVHDGLFEQRGEYSPREIVTSYRDLAGEADDPVLGVAVNTVQMYPGLLDAGLDVDGIDGSVESLERLRS